MPYCGTSTLVIQKFNDPAADRSGTQALAGWQFNVTQGGNPIAGSPFTTGAGGAAIFISGLSAGLHGHGSESGQLADHGIEG